MLILRGIFLFLFLCFNVCCFVFLGVSVMLLLFMIVLMAMVTDTMGELAFRGTSEAVVYWVLLFARQYFFVVNPLLRMEERPFVQHVLLA